VVAPNRLAGNGTPVMLLRPEKLLLRKPDGAVPAGSNRLRGRVNEVIYLGSGSKYEVTLKDGSAAIIRSSLEEPGFSIGDEVDIAFSPDDIKLLADDGRADINLT
jgi:putative spermidine/putrescine transport system ATP-binding protein